MTLIIAAKDKDGHVIIGSDRRAYRSDHYEVNDHKLIGIKNFYIGFTASYLFAQHVRFNKNRFKKDIKSSKDVYSFLKELRSLLIDNGYLDKASGDGEPEHELQFIIATSEKIFAVERNYQFLEYERYAVGSGTMYALGYFDALGRVSKDTIQEVIEATSQVVPSVCGYKVVEVGSRDKL